MPKLGGPDPFEVAGVAPAGVSRNGVRLLIPDLALTLWPEWAWAIVSGQGWPDDLVRKLVENRGWRPSDAPRSGRGPTAADRERVLHALPVGARLAIHAGKNLSGRPGAEAAHEAVAAVLGMYQRANPGRQLPFPGFREALRDCPKSAIVAVVTIDGYDQRQLTGWDVPDAWHWRFRDVQVIAEPIPCRGAQGLWAIPEPVRARLAA